MERKVWWRALRCAGLLLAFRKLNKSLQMGSDAPSRFDMLYCILTDNDALSDGVEGASL